MKKRIKGALCLFVAAFILSGCNSEDSQSISMIDAGVSQPAFSDEMHGQGVPADTTQQPADITQKPAETTQQPADTTQKPAETTQKPAETTQKPTDTTQKPAETTQKPAETTQKPEDTSATTAGEPEDDPDELPPTGTNSYRAMNYSEVRGVWISYIELSEMLTGKTAAQFTTAIGAAFDNCTALGLNTVYVHVRSHGDAYYCSNLFPQSKYVTGKLGAKADFDPLEIMIQQAHSRGLSIHAWINPLRCCAASEISGAAGTIIGEWAQSSSGKKLVNVNGTYYLNPAYTEVTDLIAAGAAEIVAEYGVDGVHIDDYFYPTTDASFDSAAYSASGYDTLSAFRFANCDRLVSGLYSAVKAANSSALFGVSCQGSIENNYNLMYADVKKWTTSDGYLDYIMPQIYYGFDNSAQPYKTCVSTWDALAVSGGKPLIVGLSVSKLGSEDTWAGEGKREWITDKDIIARQFTFAGEQQSYGGICLYSYRSVFLPDSSVKAQVEKEIEALKALLLVE